MNNNSCQNDKQNQTFKCNSVPLFFRIFHSTLNLSSYLNLYTTRHVTHFKPRYFSSFFLNSSQLSPYPLSPVNHTAYKTQFKKCFIHKNRHFCNTNNSLSQLFLLQWIPFFRFPLKNTPQQMWVVEMKSKKKKKASFSFFFSSAHPPYFFPPLPSS